MADTSAAKFPLKLLVDKERNRVIFAEADKDFIDVLFSFLTFPMGSIIRLLGNKSGIGSMDRLYQSVANLDERCFNTPACQSMLLHPRSAAEICCKGLAIDVDSDSEPWIYYRCRSSCKSLSLSPVFGARCSCGGTAETPVLASPSLGAEGSKKGFVVDGVNFIVSDDLLVQPASIGTSLGLINELGVEDGNVLEKKVVHLGREETALTDVFLKKEDTIDYIEKLMVDDIIQSREKRQIKNESTMKIQMKLFFSNDGDEVVYAEANEELVNLIFSFLTVPLGSIIKLLNKNTSLGSIDNLYKSVELLSNHIISDEWKEMLLAPKLAPFFGIDKQLLQIEEASPYKIQLRVCKTCLSFSYSNRCCNGYNLSSYGWMNPKSLDSGLERGGGYVKPMGKFMITDGMDVTFLSPIDSVHIINKLMVPISSLEEVAACLGVAEVCLN
ncbi:hypothetical protein HPP92_012578 [Vanilla planifolia]|uniref:DUF674 family protein n=1 Tax=Vanilla planifolia TaxID=51239 RepID=A0A835V2V4_VANPL|nr:hypothetical protein HPP92_012578 [Vanilla planifolia]